MQVRFYFDPRCPWCWLTSRWLVQEVVPHRDLEIDWRPISLYVRNEGRKDDKYLEAVRWSFKLLRIVEALREDGRADDIEPLYTEYGRRIHHEEQGDFEPEEALEAAGIPVAYAKAFEDDRWDQAVRDVTAEAEALAGDDVGTPIVAHQVDGEWRGYFGPVIPEVVRGDDALRLWDGLSLMIQAPGFYELKRTRTQGPTMPTDV